MSDDTVTSSVINTTSATTNNNDTLEFVVEEDTAKYYTSSNDLLQIVNEISLNPNIQQSNNDTDDNAFNNVTKSTPTTAPTLRQFLPTEICIRIVQYLLVPCIQMKHVTAIGCSSQYIDTMMRRQRRTNHNDNNHNNINDNNQHNIDRLTLLSHCLTDDESTWWISEEGLDVRPQYVDFRCIPPPPPPPPPLSGSNTTSNDISSSSSSSSTRIHSAPWLVRLQSVSIKIPPLPYGPMSLREFVLQRPKPHSSVWSSNSSYNTHIPDTQDDGEENEQAKIEDTTPTVEWETISPTWTLHGYTSGYQSFTFPSGGVDVNQIRLLCLSNQISVDDYDHVLRQRHEDGVPQSVGFYSIRFD